MDLYNAELFKNWVSNPLFYNELNFCQLAARLSGFGRLIPGICLPGPAVPGYGSLTRKSPATFFIVVYRVTSSMVNPPLQEG